MSAALTFSLGSLADGADGIRQTLGAMRRFVRKYRTNGTIYTLARSIVDPVRAKDYYGEMVAVFKWVQNHIRYVRDIDGVESVQTPLATLEIGQGDCDDMATLLAALLSAIGAPVRFAALGFAPSNEYSHVIVEALVGRETWVPMDAIVPGARVGWRPPGVTRLMVVHI